MKKFAWAAAAAILVLAVVAASFIWPKKTLGVNWPKDQALPSFKTPAPTLDFVNYQEKLVYEGENTDYEHETGQADGSAWKAVTGIDKPGALLFDAKTITDLPAGETKGTFVLSVDHFADENGVVATLVVKDEQSGVELGKLDVNAWDFNNLNSGHSFDVPFTVPESGHPLEFQVIWTGHSTLVFDKVEFSSPSRAEEVAMFYTLQGLVNKTEPRMYKNDGSSTAAFWLDALKLDYKPVKDIWTLLDKYRSASKGLVVYDPDVPDTYNLATTIAGLKEALVVSPSLVEKLSGEPYRYPILDDLRGKYKTNLDVYSDLYDHYWSQTTHRVIVGLTPEMKTNLREYAIAIQASVIWLNPDVPEEEKLLSKFFADMPSGSGLYLGWWPEEGAGVRETSKFGLATVAADWSANLTVLSGTSREITPPKPTPTKPKLENKAYVAYFLSDGDNLQYMEGAFRSYWSSPDRGEVPLGWTVSPLMVDAMPGVLDYLNRTATDNDVLVSGPSGLGYTYPVNWSDDEGLASFYMRTNDYMKRAGLRVLTIWNGVTAKMDERSANVIAKYAPSLLGFTSQGNTGQISVYDQSMPMQELNKGYGSTEGDLINPVQGAMKKWDRKSPLFVGVQVDPWHTTYANFVNAYQHLKDDPEIVFVRPDVYFELIRQSKGLPVDPAS
ncbi:GxGYxYP domain-containing protein [Gorillibacterium timonense]|uniref:GxGYxYP domain-containing protein n=1 Tax=Gorillibacterium timonense TaxID=1689269 RepID=UPI0011DDF9F8|nr:GxGYxYP domain-containing protein [Gorillibacterium timonense]